MAENKAANRKKLAGWAKALAPVALGGLAGLAVAVLLQRNSDEGAPPRPPAPPPVVRAAPAPRPQQASRPAPPAAVRPAVPPAAAPTGAAVPAWQRFAVAAGPVAGRPMIAVIVDDMGLDRRRSARAVALPGPLTLAFLTYGRELPEQTAAARRAGHELLVHIPMQPDDGAADPGPNVLRADLAPEELERRLAWGLTRFAGYVGVNNHMGSRFTADRRAMMALFAGLRRRGLLFVDSRTTPRTAAPWLAHEMSLPFAERNVFLDNENDSSEVRQRLRQTEHIARRNGLAVAIGHPRDATLEALAAWLPTLGEAGFALVPVSAIVRERLRLASGAAGAGNGGR